MRETLLSTRPVGRANAAPCPRHGPRLPSTRSRTRKYGPPSAGPASEAGGDSGPGRQPGHHARCSCTQGKSHRDTHSEGARPVHRPPDPCGKATFRPQKSPEPMASLSPSLWGTEPCLQVTRRRNRVSRALSGTRKRHPSQKDTAMLAGRPELRVPGVRGGGVTLVASLLGVLGGPTSFCLLCPISLYPV